MTAIEQMRGSVEALLRRDGHRTASENASVHEETDEFSTLDRPVAQAVLKAAALPAVVGGLVGALVAVIVVLAMTELRTPLDPRLPRLAEQVGGFQQSMYDLETTLRGVEVDVVRALDADAALATRLDAQAGEIRAAMAEIDEARQALRVETGPGSVVFGVSAVQLTDAVASGRPFEGEWVNLYALSAGDEALREQLRRLIPMAGTGVATLTALRAGLRSSAAAAGMPAISPKNLYQYGLNVVRSGLGVPIGTTAEQQVASGLVREADRRLSVGDLEGGLAVLADLTEPAAGPFKGWIADARRRVMADTVAAELLRISQDALRTRAKADAGGAGANRAQADGANP